MSNQYFSIQQLGFAIGFSSKEKGYELQNRISRLYHQQLHALLQSFFYRTVPEDVLIRKDSLLLDLGRLSYNELETELPKRLEKALAEQFAVFLLNDNNGQPAAGGFESLPAAGGYESLLEYFLTTGTLPWQASVHPHLTWQVMLQELYKRQRDALGRLLCKLGRLPAVRVRLAFQSAAEDLQQIITAAEPVEAPFILAYKKKMEAIQQEKQLVRSDAVGFRQAIAYFILTYLFEEKESLFSKKAFIKSVLYQMAAHYNISFTGLLQVLYDALPAAVTAARSTGSLFGLIQALFMESRSSIIQAEYTGNDASEHTPSAAGALALVEYFLVTGRLPKQATAKGAFTWQAVLDELYERDRDGLNLLLRRLGREHPVRKRLAYQLTEEALQKVFEVLEPVEAPFIIVYKKNIVEVQYDKQLVMAAGTDLRRAVSFFILTYLLEERESIFSKRMFIKSVLRQMAGHYNVSFPDLLAVLYEAVPAENITGSQQASFFQTIRDIYREEQFAPGSRGVTASGTFSTRVNRSIADALHYFLQHGAMPWWVKEKNGQAPGTLLQQLYTHSVEDALQLLKSAGMQQRSKQRFVWQFPEPLLYKVFSHLPGWNGAMAIVELTIQFIEAIPALRRISWQSLKYAMLDAVWSSYIKQGYNAFNETHFYQLVLEHLAYVTTIDRLEIGDLFREAIGRESAALINAGSDETLRRFGRAIDLFSAGNTVTAAGAAGRIRHDQLDPLLRSYAGTAAAVSGRDRLQQVIGLLEYYLTWNRFPDRLLTGSRQEQDNLLEAMLLLLYHENREGLKRVLQSDKHSATARMRLHHLFTSGKGGEFKQASLFLDAYMEKDALQYIKEMAGNRSIASEAGFNHLLEKAKAGMGEGMATLLRDLLRKIKAGINLPAVDKEIMQMLQVPERRLQQRADEEVQKKQQEAAARKKEEETNKALQRQLQQELQMQKEARQKQPMLSNKTEQLYVTNAGLVLLHPFLGTYFTRLNLMNEGQFVNREAQARAVHLLQYLAYNTTEHPEHELVLNKILCNYPLHEPLPLEITPEPNETGLSAELLQVVIQRSGKLSGSTVDGFRVSFLHREGVLTETEAAWTLRVEQRGYDMILQTLPWAFGMIKFSWMDKPVEVEWV
ncbi:contractile injection system tape measure protein [Niastella populi]|uniref:Uncharacterized protein n=1 Tax=Niastella populi TaxID=550983 RepID=A0A1V9GC62_9BACT|nr:contractile injection system tape measure protein [Niastella populi]OQP68265.1 hypothetical protein A4R26_00185 [Niastella populi]